MYKLKFTLKQHTPLIHFQHNQEGATLRASEVKPRFDRFIFEKLGHGNYVAGSDYANSKKWLIKGAENPALDYKLIFKDDDPRPIALRSFDNIKLISDILIDKKAISSNDIRVTLFSYNTELREKVTELLPEFFLINNFGTRQSKAWGSYYHESHSNWDLIKQSLLTTGLPIYIFGELISKTDRETNKSNFYPKISKKWRILKSGVNLKFDGGATEYKKSLLFKYMCSNGFRWDKRWMKQRINEMILDNVLPQSLEGTTAPNDCYTNITPCDTSNTTNSWIDDQNLNYSYRFGRAMLGLPEHIEFRANNNYIYQINVKNNYGINRFKSPVVFKLFENKLFAIARHPLEMMNQEFEFEVQKKKKPYGGKPVNEGDAIKILNNDSDPYTLKSPHDINEFNIEIFLNDYFSCIGFQRLTATNLTNL